MHPQDFVLISRAFSDGVSVRKDGPVLTKEYSSECVLERNDSFVTAACFVSKLVPKTFVTTLKVDEKLTYYESIVLERRAVMKNFSETVYLFWPKDKVNKFCSRLLYEPGVARKRYVAGIDLWPAQKCAVTDEVLHHASDADAITCEKSAINGDIACNRLINGETL